jgi:16S rRNA (uracil1498-N3)-methyltransferase
MERYDFRTQRLHVDAPLLEGATVDADRNQANYLLNVLRLKAGANVLLFNGRDGEWLAGVHPDGRKACKLTPLRQTRPQPQPASLIYCFAPLKHSRLDYMVQKAVEMGAGILQPVITRHTQVSRLNLERMQANAIEAAEQCGILAVPRCNTEISFETLLRDWDDSIQLVFCDEAAADADALENLKPLKGRRLGVLIGPEGGFSPEERERLRSLAFVTPIALGPRIMRADTAAVAALAIVQAAAGDWTP